MNWYESSLRSKTLVLIGSLLTVLAATVLWGYWSSWSTTVAFDHINRTSVAQERAILSTVVDFKEQVQEWKNVLLRGKDPQALDKYWKAFVGKERDIQDSGKRLLSQITSEEARKLLTDFLAAHQRMGEGYRKGLQAFKDSGMDSKAGDAAVKGVDRAPTELLEKAAKAVSNDTENGLALIFAGAWRSMLISVALFSTVLVVVVISMAVFINRRVVGPIRSAVHVAEGLARGDLSQEIVVVGRDEVGQLLASFQTMNQQLGDTIRRVKEATGSIAVASKQIASGNADLSQRTEEQASSLEETASSMEELTSTVKQNAESAKQANQLAATASEVAVRGGEVVGQVVGTMSSINDSSKKIADIIGVIDGIAFQTNILALNAAVEAARAGEQGRGFAVVATEVRTLAQRSAAAAKEIKQLIGDSVAKVEDGTRLVDQAGKTMEEIVSSVKRVTDIMAEISAASQEQSSGIEQVNQAVTQMDEVTQQNAALVEEAAAAAESMQEQAQSLTEAVSVFKLVQGEAGMNNKPRLASVPEPTIERRAPTRAKNVTRLPAKAEAKAKAEKPESQARAKTGTDDEWSEF